MRKGYSRPKLGATYKANGSSKSKPQAEKAVAPRNPFLERLYPEAPVPASKEARYTELKTLLYDLMVQINAASLIIGENRKADVIESFFDTLDQALALRRELRKKPARTI